MLSTNPLVLSATVLEHYYGNDGVTWQDAPRHADAVKLAITRIKRLRRKPQKRPRPDFNQLQIADTLAGCEHGHRCLNGTCPDCQRALQRWLAETTVTMASDLGEGIVKIALTIIPPMPLSETISGAALKDVLANVSNRVASVPLVEAAILCADVSYNDFTQIAGADWNGPTEGWQPHVHGVVCVRNRDDAKRLKRALKELFPRTQSVEVPVYGRFYDGTALWASYLLKYEFQRRVSYYDATTGDLGTSDYDLTAEHDVMVMRAMSELGLTGRIQLIGIRTVEDHSKKQFRLNVTSMTVG